MPDFAAFCLVHRTTNLHIAPVLENNMVTSLYMDINQLCVLMRQHELFVTTGMCVLYSICVLQALEVYPYSGRLLGMLAECEQRGHTLSRLRLHLTKRCQDTSAALLWLMAIKAEAVLPAGAHRVQVHPAVLCCAVLCLLALCCAVLHYDYGLPLP